MIPKTIKHPHIVEAARRIDRGTNRNARPSRTYDVIIGERRYPPKYIVSIAAEIATGRPLAPDMFGGGEETNGFLVGLGFVVVKKGQGMVKAHAKSPKPPKAKSPIQRGGHGRRSNTADPSHAVAVSVAMTGDPSSGVPDNRTRAVLLGQIVDEIVGHNRRGDPSVVLFPGGFFRLSSYVGNLDSHDRRKVLDAAPFGAACRAAAARLRAVAPDAVLAVGVDSVEWHREWGDQMCVAWGPNGVIGVGRKVFPTRGKEAQGMVINLADFEDLDRVVPLPGGRRAVLCSCYDGFGVASPDERAGYIRKLRVTVGGRVLDCEGTGFDAALARGRESWRALLADVDVALIAIHGFGAGKNSSMWQRHGISTASAALTGGLALAGAHFKKRLPSGPNVQTLASMGVPAAHLEAGHRRKAEALAPLGSARVGPALVRWFPY